MGMGAIRRGKRLQGLFGALLLSSVLATPAWAAEVVRVDTSVLPPQSSAVPIPKGQIEKAVAKLDGLAEGLLKRTGIPGLSVVVVHDGKTVFAKGFGVRKAGAPEKVDAETVFQLASLSKSVGATVVAREVGRGTVSWDTPVKDLLLWFALKDAWVSDHLTIADLYTHRSGLPDHAGDALEDLGFDQRQVLERLRLLPLAPFRSTYAYTNFGLTAAAEAVAKAAGKDWASLSEQDIYQPLGMVSTSSRFADYMARANRAWPHVKVDGAFVSKYQRQPDAQSPAGGVSSNARDMGRWLAFVLGNGMFAGSQLVPQAALMPAVTAQIVSSPSFAVDARAGFYGHGFGVGTSPSGRVTISHSGAFYMGAGTTFTLLPSQKLGIAVLTNAWPEGAAESLAMDFMDLVEFGTVTRDWLTTLHPLFAPLFKPEGSLAGKKAPASPAPAQPIAAYAGTYDNPYFGPAQVREDNGKLIFQLGPKPLAVPMAHWDGDAFTFIPEGENAPEGSIAKVTFALDGGRAKALTVDIYNESGLGTFTRK